MTTIKNIYTNAVLHEGPGTLQEELQKAIASGANLSEANLSEVKNILCLPVGDPSRYTSPALGTPELDAILFAAGQRWLRKHNDWRFKHDFAGYITKLMPETLYVPWDDWLLWDCDTPGHALARAIAEVRNDI